MQIGRGKTRYRPFDAREFRREMRRYLRSDARCSVERPLRATVREMLEQAVAPATAIVERNHARIRREGIPRGVAFFSEWRGRGRLLFGRAAAAATLLRHRRIHSRRANNTVAAAVSSSLPDWRVRGGETGGWPFFRRDSLYTVIG